MYGACTAPVVVDLHRREVMRHLFVVGLVVTGACVGTIDVPNGTGSPDAATASPGSGSGSGSSASPDAAPTPDAPVTGFACRNAAPPPGNGHHNAGQDCQQGCHNHGFSFSGTLYTSAAGTTIASGATITAIDANGAVIEVVSQTNGNFYATTPVTFPIAIYASSCPTVQHMSATVVAGDGGCNKTGCHTAAGTGRVHLP